jgi:hypothetical protein
MLPRCAPAFCSELSFQLAASDALNIRFPPLPDIAEGPFATHCGHSPKCYHRKMRAITSAVAAATLASACTQPLPVTRLTPTTEVIREFETEQLQTEQVESTNYGAMASLSDSGIKLPVARVRDVLCTGNSITEAECSYRSDYCSNNEPSAGESFCRKTKRFVRHEDGFWYPVPTHRQ